MSREIERLARENLQELESDPEPFSAGRLRLHPLTELIAAGGEKIVVTAVASTSRERGLVIKVPHQLLTHSLLEKDEGKNPEGQVSLDRLARKMGERFDMLQKTFGAHVAKERFRVGDVPVSAKVANDFFRSAGDTRTATKTLYVPTVLTVQERVPEEIMHESQDFGCRYMELRAGIEEYSLLNEMLLDESRAFEEKLFDSTIKPETCALLNAAEENELLRRTLIEFAQTAIRFTNQTGELLDLVGSRNVIMFQQDGQWDYRLLDVLAGDQGYENELRKFFAENGVLSARTLNAINYARTMHGIALTLGLPNRLNFVHEVIGDASWKSRSDDLWRDLRAELARNGVLPKVVVDDGNQMTAPDEIATMPDSVMESVADGSTA